jgi:hypothetical protein
MKNQDFPPLGESKKSQQLPWNRVQTEKCNNDALDSKKALFLINENLVKTRESNKIVEGRLEKIDYKLNQTVLDTELHQTTVVNLIEYVRLLIQHIVWPVTKQIKPELLHSKTGLQSVYDKLRDLKINLCSDYEVRRKRAASPI